MNGKAQEKRPQEATREEALFSYEVIPEQQWFVCDLRFAATNDAQAFLKAIEALSTQQSQLLIGRRRRPVEINHFTVTPDLFFHHRGSSQSLTIVLTSDLIARSPWLSFVTEPVLEDWRRLLAETACHTGLISSDAELTTNGVKVSFSKTEAVPVYGFNSATGLFRSSALALKRGSVVQFAWAQETGDDAQLALWRKCFEHMAREDRGLGERTAEGFGRVLVDPDWHLSSTIHETERMLAAVEKFFDEHQQPIQNISMSQWQWLRSEIERTGGPTRVLETLAEHSNKKAGKPWTAILKPLQHRLQELNLNEHSQLTFLNSLARRAVAWKKRSSNLDQTTDEKDS